MIHGRRFLEYFVACLFLAWSTHNVSALDLYVSPSGNDGNDGSTTAPLASLAAAKIAACKHAGKEVVTIHVADGTYYLPETLVFTPRDSGSTQAPVIYKAEKEWGAILSGGSHLDLKWEPFRDGIFKAATTPGLRIDQLFIDGKCQRMARYPNYDASKKTDAYQGCAADAFSKLRAAKWAEPVDGYIHAMHSQSWGGYHYRITGKGTNGEITYEGGWQNNRQMGMSARSRMVENIFEELDAPGEWFHDSKIGTLYYMPEAVTDLTKAKVEVVRLKHLVEFQGTEADPVHEITLSGFLFRHAARTFMETKEPLLRSDWTIYRGGAVMLTGTKDIHILDSEFDQLGGNALFVNGYNRGTLIKGCNIHDTGASGVCFVGQPSAVRNPLFEYNQQQDPAGIDKTPGPKDNNYPADCAVEDCLIHGIGRVERQPSGVQISMAQSITVKDCSIYDCARSGINIGDGCWGGHLIEGCDVFDTVLETHDHGSFNSWGRDRYWSSDRQAPEVPELAFLDAVKTTEIRNSRWRCDHGWDIDLDDGSTNYDIHDNLLLRGGLKFREGYRRRAWNNVLVNEYFHPHVWYRNSDDEFFNNIVMGVHHGVGVPNKNGVKGKLVDNNLFYTGNPKAQRKFINVGWDQNSLEGDPLFIDPAKGDFRVKEGSPALKLGFKNFPMDSFGVKKPALKALAKTPEIPTPASHSEGMTPAQSNASKDESWMGMKLHGLQGEEFSAFGTTQEEGGVQITEIAAGSDGERAGLKDNDLILAVNDNPTKGVADFMKAVREAGDQRLEIRLVRNQKPLRITVTQKKKSP